MVEAEGQPNEVSVQMRLFVDGTFEDAERHLKLPAGSISGIRDDADYLLLLKLNAVIEPVLNDLIRYGFNRPTGGLGGEDLKDRFESTIGLLEKLPLNGRPGRIQLARSLGVIDSVEEEFIFSVARLRNGYAHNISSMFKPLIEIYRAAQKDDQRLLQKLTLGTTWDGPEVGEVELRFLIIIGFSVFLSQSLSRLHRPEAELFAAMLNLNAGQIVEEPG